MSRCPGPLKQTLPCTVTGCRALTEEIFSLACTWQGPPPRAGQFFLLKPQRSSVFLGRPLSVAHYTPPSDQSGLGQLTFSLAARGEGTWELAGLKSGDLLELTGPLGRSWSAVAPEPLEGPVALVGGGIGVVPCVALAAELPPGTFDFYGGFKSRPFGLETLPPKACIIATEDGSQGRRGRILDFLEPARYCRVYACGPEPLLKALAQRCAAQKVPCFISMERPMACGVGACLGCTVQTTGGNRRCCVDGPVFRAEEVLFYA
ncbi:MAG: dihydroorotate dehydrogenase electron transfer subunit [Spirochaetaceae bacterium]|jgi:NAD(P)H-flavin reductase|nr:dihydroorotate dehydrogenase electron transfer subunit [Spirochaetaceae bacterium]